MRKLITTAILVLAITIAVLVARSFLNTDSERADGLKLLRDGQYEPAFELLESHLQKNPDDAAARVILADSYRDQDRHSFAATHYKILAETPSRRDSALRSMAAMAIQEQDFELADECLLLLLKDRPADFSANLALAELYFNNDRVTDSLPYIKACIEAEPNRPESYLLLADALAAANRLHESIEPLERCLELDPDNMAAHANIAHAYLSDGNIDAALEHAEWCLARNKNLYAVRLILAKAQRDTGKFDAALSNARLVLDANPASLEAALVEADVLFYERDAGPAYDRLMTFIEEHPEDRELISRLMRAAIATGRSEKAKELRDRLIELVPE